MKNQFLNLYFVTSIMMDLLMKSVESEIYIENLSGKNYQIKKAHKENHKKLIRAIEQSQKCIEKLSEEYTEALSMQNFDNIRSDANFLLRNIMRIYNASGDKESRNNVESVLKELCNISLFSEGTINKFKLK